MTGGDELSGAVQPGRELGSELLRDPVVAERFEAIAGFAVVPVTLNVRLPGPLARDGRWRYVAAEAIAPDWRERTGQTGYHLLDVLVARRYRAVAFQADEPDDLGYPPDQIELLSDTHLRSALGLADGDPIEIAAIGNPGTGPPRPAPV
jgi:CTP-dependent riboflavin kinase